MLLAHRKQFVLGPRPVRVRADWVIVEIAPGLILSHCPMLSVAALGSRDGQPFHLLGLAVSSLAAEPVLAEAFRKKPGAEIEQWTGFWSGKWLLISPDCCRQDALSFMGVHYRRVGGDLWLSGSTALLGEHLPGVAAAARIPWQIAFNKGMDWIPAPFSSREGVFKLLPLRTIEPRTGVIRPVRFVAPSSDQRDVAPALAGALTAILANLGRCSFRHRLVGLTAGLDTRTVLPAACASGLAFKTFTIAYPITKRRDIVMAPRVAAAVGVPHSLKRLAPADAADIENRFATISAHMDGAAFHPAWRYYASTDDKLMNDPERVIIAANCFEIGRCSFWRKFANVGLAEAPPTGDQLISAFSYRSSWRPGPQAEWRQAVQSWISSLTEPVPIIRDWRDRFDLDQRCGSWHANLAHGYDIFDTTRFCPANCMWIMHLLMQFPPAQRLAGVAQREAIRLLNPRLLQIPFNPEPLSKRLKNRARAVLGPTGVRALRSLVMR